MLKEKLVGIMRTKLVNPFSYIAYTLIGFDDQERKLTFVKTDFQVLKNSNFMPAV